jgi:hypothetical protein
MRDELGKERGWKKRGRIYGGGLMAGILIKYKGGDLRGCLWGGGLK